MKRSIGLRILLAVSGLIFLAEAAALIADKFFDVPVFAYLEKVSPASGTLWLVIILAAAFLACILTVMCWTAMFDRSSRRHYVQQHTESGALDISMVAIESLVKKCTDCHEDIQIKSTRLENTRGGLIIRLRACLASGVNIPLTVSALQKQIRQYVTACSGIDVREVAVTIEQTDGRPSDESCLVPGPDAGKVIRDPDPTPVSVNAQESAENSEERLLHQRLFGHQEVEASLPEAPDYLAESSKEEEPAEDMSDSEEPVEPDTQNEWADDSSEADYVHDADTVQAAETDEDVLQTEDPDSHELEWTLDDVAEDGTVPDMEAEETDSMASEEKTQTGEERQDVT